ncbi:uncharacterized protein LOC135805438 [Sycon ciliatum]|uniref:uncharacterized protein LOC135805438 n=1 Tax=Sycon ciliatum TaxID=27933 RepID=UPI0020AB489C
MDDEKKVSGGSVLDREARREIRLFQEQYASALTEEITRLEQAASLVAGGRESLLDREVAIRQEIRALQERRAAEMKDEISRLSQTNELHAATTLRMQAQLQQATQREARCKQRIARANQELKSCKEKLLYTEMSARQDRLLFKDAQQQLKEATTNLLSRSLMLKLKRAKTELDEQHKLAKECLKELERERFKHHCRCLLYPNHAELLQQLAPVPMKATQPDHSDSSAAISAILMGKERMVSRELDQSRKWIREKVKSVQEDMETVRIICGLWKTMSLDAGQSTAGEKVDSQNVTVMIRENSSAGK